MSTVHPSTLTGTLLWPTDIPDIGVQNIHTNRGMSKYVNAMGKEFLKYLNQRVYIRRRNRHVIATHLMLACFMVMIDIEGQ